MVKELYPPIELEKLSMLFTRLPATHSRNLKSPAEGEAIPKKGHTSELFPARDPLAKGSAAGDSTSSELATMRIICAAFSVATANSVTLKIQKRPKGREKFRQYANF